MVDRPLTPAGHDELVFSLSQALQFNRKGKRTHERDSMSARLAAEHLVEAMRLGGYVVMKGPPAPAHSAPSDANRVTD